MEVGARKRAGREGRRICNYRKPTRTPFLGKNIWFSIYLLSWSREPRGKLLGLNDGVWSSSGLSAVEISCVTTQLRHGPEVKTLFLFAYFCAMGLAETNFPFLGADGTDYTHFICHISQPGKLTSHKPKNQA